MSPRRRTYLDLVVESEKTPVLATKRDGAVWGVGVPRRMGRGEPEGRRRGDQPRRTRPASCCSRTYARRRYSLTGDAGVRALTEAYGSAARMGKLTSPLDWFQVPHHGSRRNLSSSVLDAWLGSKLSGPSETSSSYAIISANRKDHEHPKKAVVRALIHRGRSVYQTNGTLHVRSSGAPDRGWPPVTPLQVSTGPGGLELLVRSQST